MASESGDPTPAKGLSIHILQFETCLVLAFFSVLIVVHFVSDGGSVTQHENDKSTSGICRSCYSAAQLGQDSPAMFALPTLFNGNVLLVSWAWIRASTWYLIMVYGPKVSPDYAA